MVTAGKLKTLQSGAVLDLNRDVVEVQRQRPSIGMVKVDAVVAQEVSAARGFELQGKHRNAAPEREPPRNFC